MRGCLKPQNSTLDESSLRDGDIFGARAPTPWTAPYLLGLKLTCLEAALSSCGDIASTGAGVSRPSQLITEDFLGTPVPLVGAASGTAEQ